MMQSYLVVRITLDSVSLPPPPQQHLCQFHYRGFISFLFLTPVVTSDPLAPQPVTDLNFSVARVTWLITTSSLCRLQETDGWWPQMDWHNDSEDSERSRAEAFLQKPPADIFEQGYSALFWLFTCNSNHFFRLFTIVSNPEEDIFP